LLVDSSNILAKRKKPAVPVKGRRAFTLPEDMHFLIERSR
jgi:hypothetical protein